MRAWKSKILTLSLLLATCVAVQAEDNKPDQTGKAKPVKKQHMVDMADSVNNNEFYQSENPDGVWSSELKTPWAKSDAINAYSEGDKPAGTRVGEAADAAAATGGSTATAPSTDTVGDVNGTKVNPDQLVNIRARYSMDENAASSLTPVFAQNTLFRQMSHTCKNGFQKIAEWSEPVQGNDYYLYYQFKCMPKH